MTLVRDLARARAVFQARTLEAILTEGKYMRHPLDGNAIAADEHYDADEIGTEDGQPCGRYPEPDEDQPRGYRPKPCQGVMVYDECGCCIQCDTCGEYA